MNTECKKMGTRYALALLIVGFWANGASAVPVQWFFQDLTFVDGAVGNGSFFFDGEVPFGSGTPISNVNLAVSGGTVFRDMTFRSVNPASRGNAELLFFVEDETIEVSDIGFYADLTERMTSAGGTVALVTSGNPAFHSQYACAVAASCGVGGTPQNPVLSGFVTTSPVPLPATAWLFLTAMGMLFGLRKLNA